MVLWKRMPFFHCSPRIHTYKPAPTPGPGGQPRPYLTSEGLLSRVLQGVHLEWHTAFEWLSTGFTGKWHIFCVCFNTECTYTQNQFTKRLKLEKRYVLLYGHLNLLLSNLWGCNSEVERITMLKRNLGVEDSTIQSGDAYWRHVAFGLNKSKLIQVRQFLISCPIQSIKHTKEQGKIIGIREKQLTNHMFPYMSHGIEFLLTNFTGKFLFCISMDNLDMFMKGPEFLERFITGNTLSRINRNNLYL